MHRTIPGTPTAPPGKPAVAFAVSRPGDHERGEREQDLLRAAPVCTCTTARRCRPDCHGPSPEQWTAAAERLQREAREREELDRAARGPLVHLRVPGFQSAVRLQNASGGLESIWLTTLGENGLATRYEASLGQALPCPARLTPSDARRLAAVLLAYADAHPDTEGT